MAKKDYDFSGWATKFGVKCADGVTIAPGAFSDNNNKTVPLVYNHDHQDMDLVIGHADLEERPEGMFAYCKFNNTPKGQTAKELVRNGDITSLSIYANRLKKSTGNVVTHGLIREVSLVLAGANPGACIVSTLMHSDEDFNEDNFNAIIYQDDEDEVLSMSDTSEDEETVEQQEETIEETNNEEINNEEPEDTVEHADENSNGETIEDILNSMSNKQRLAAFKMIQATLERFGMADENANDMLNVLSQSIDTTEEISEDETVNSIVDTYTDKQRGAVEYILGSLIPEEAVKQSGIDENTEESLQHNLEEETQTMKNNVFDQTLNNNEEVLTHDEFMAIMSDAKRNGSVKEAFIAHGITDVSKLFPEVQLTGEKPAVINNDVEWVNGVISGTKKTPFSRIKTIAVDVTGENARAKGYVKGNKKVEEVISALKRSTDPQTVYKLQKMDRDDILDITDFDVLAFLKNEMKGKLNEEIARAILTGDGRSAGSPDKINPTHIRPILGDDTTYTTANITAKKPTDVEEAKAFIKKVRKARKDYKGTGKPDLYIDSILLDDLLLIEDKNERFIYETEEQLAKTLRVNKIIPVEYFNTVIRLSDDEKTNYTLQAIMVNLTDYTVGADKGGNVTMFEDFDLDYNKQEYLIETRISGALTKPFSAVTFEISEAVSQTTEQATE